MNREHIPVRAPRLTSAQASYLKRLHLDGGHCPLGNATYQTALALHDKGMVIVEVITPVEGRVMITDDGRRVAQAIIDLLASPRGRVDVGSLLSGTPVLSSKEG